MTTTTTAPRTVPAGELAQGARIDLEGDGRILATVLATTGPYTRGADTLVTLVLSGGPDATITLAAHRPLELQPTAATITITDSEDGMFAEIAEKRKFDAMPLAVGARMIDAAHAAHAIRYKIAGGGYRKTYFTIDYTDPANGEPSQWTGRFDLGCDADTLAEHVIGHAKLMIDRNPANTEALRIAEDILAPAMAY